MFAEAQTIELSRYYAEEIRENDRTVPLMSASNPDPRLFELLARGASFLNLGENWNSYRSRPIDVNMLIEGLRLVSMVLVPDRRAPSIVPTALGGVQLEWHAPTEDLEIEVRSLGVYKVYHRKGDFEDEFEVRDDLTRLVSLARAFPR